MQADQTRYTGMKVLSQDQGIPIGILKKAKARNAPGFRLNNSINYSELKPWLDQHMSELIAADTVADIDNVSLEDLKKEKLQRDIAIADLEIQKRKREFLDPEEVKGFLSSMAVAQSAVLKKVIKELPPKCAGRSAGEIEAILETHILEVFTIFRQGIDKFMEKK